MIETSIIILTRNEIAGVKQVIKNLPTLANAERYAVDYKSRDGTVEYFQKHKIPVISQKKKGRSEAFRIGAKHARGTYLVFFSPDGNENPKDIPTLIRYLRKGNDLVIASRFMKGSRNEEDGKILKLRAWANRWFTFFANLLFHGRVTDSINGYRAISKKAYNRLHLDGEGFVMEYQMTIRALKLGMKISEIPTVEGDRIGGKSTSYAIPTGLSFLFYLLREIMIGKAF